MDNLIRKIENSLHKGFIDTNVHKSGAFKPKLLINNVDTSENVLSSLLEELDHCKSFIFSVAFITESGLATLKSHLLDLNRKGIKGKIITSTYLNFNTPKVFRELLKLKNVEVRLTDLKGFHSKGYIFERDSYYSLIVGSSNLTAHALKVNYEWNIKLTSHENGEIVHHFKQQFEEVWNRSLPLNEFWIRDYETQYERPKDRIIAQQVAEIPTLYNTIEESLKIQPNKMQKTALQQIENLRENGEDKGLIISATGTGKTYLSAFDVRRFSPKKMLFIVHREQILNKAKDDFRRVLGGIEEDFGILSGTSKQTSAKYLFATIQTISKEETLNQFSPEEFDYVLIDEVHKAGAISYQRVIEYFKPQFLMGMTATPERTDDFNIYQLFDYNIAYEIRLQEALEEDMLCPFHYFGVTDLEIDGEITDDAIVLTQLVTEERINHIIDKVTYYGYSGNRVRGLMFCSRKEEAKKLSLALNEKGFRTVALTGDDSQEVRERSVSELESGQLDYILTVDIFNEGVDIPSINQVVMLRQTQSSIIFIQQLGRGLRKHDTKSFVTIIDFIGNYKNNYLIPIALSGDKSQNKDNIRRETKDTSYIKGVSTVNFEEIAEKRIFKAINNSKLTDLKVLKEAYIELKNRIGRTPFLHDFITNHSIDPLVIVEKYKNYQQFLLKLGEEVPSLSVYEDKVVTMISVEILNGKRKHEIILLDMLFKHEQIAYEKYIEELKRMNCTVDESTLRSVLRILDLSFYTESERRNYGERPIVYLNESKKFVFNDLIQESLKTNLHFKTLIKDLLKSSMEKSKRYNNDQPLTLHEKYTRKDVCRLLNWDHNEQSTMYGYKTKHGTTPIFITYHKDDEIEESVKYDEEFVSEEVLKWSSKNTRKISSPEVQRIINTEELNIDMHVFVQKDDKEERGFYYLGKALPDKESIKEVGMNAKGRRTTAVHMNLILEQPVEHMLYHYLIN